MDHVVLKNNVRMPILGFGVFQVPDPAECERAVLDALHAGYRLIDTAASYMNEEAVGRAIRGSGVARDDIFVTTKLWVQDAGYEKTKQAFDRSMRRLGLDSLDLYLIHQPYNDVFGAWRAMEELLREGRVRAIGVANFTPDRLMDLVVNSGVVPAIDQIETHPFHPQVETQKFLQESGIQIESWGPFAEGRDNIFSNEVLLSVARPHGKTVAQVILRWLIQRGIVAIPKSVHKERIVENLDVFDFDLTPTEMATITGLGTNVSNFFDHRDPDVVKRISERKLPI
jgi:2,5-diketo-D-gluconate reductase A